MKKFFVALISLFMVCGTALASFPTGIWRGELQVAPGASLELVLNISEEAGKPTVTLDSPSQGAYDIPGEVVSISDTEIEVAVPSIGMRYKANLKAGTLAGTFSQGNVNLPLNMSLSEAKAAGPSRPQTPVAPFPYSAEEVTFPGSDGKARLAGTLTVPEGADASTPVVVLVSGSGQQNRDEELFGHKPFAVIADYLARNGIATLRYDDRNTGGSKGEVETATTADFAKDAAGAVEFLRDSGRFGATGILGHSEGAVIAFMLAAKGIPDFIIGVGAPAVRGSDILAFQNKNALLAADVPEDISALYAGALPVLYRNLEAGDKEKALQAAFEVFPGGDPITDALRSNFEKITDSATPWLIFFAGYSPEADIAATSCPALVLFGEKDMQVPPSLNEANMRRLLPKGDIRVIPGLNHLMQHAVTGGVEEYAKIEETFAPEALEAIKAFIAEHFGR